MDEPTIADVDQFIAANPKEVLEVCKALKAETHYEHGAIGFAYALGRLRGGVKS